jgi:hypothetical protein
MGVTIIFHPVHQLSGLCVKIYLTRTESGGLRLEVSDRKACVRKIELFNKPREGHTGRTTSVEASSGFI